MFVNENLCSECGGKCCKFMPGACYPEDFGLPGDFKNLSEALSSGHYCIDWWEGDPREGKDDMDCAYFVRPVIKNMVGKKYDATWGGECFFLKSNGCSLPEDNRPLNCKALEPKKDECILHNDIDKRGASIAWLSYQDYLER